MMMVKFDEWYDLTSRVNGKRVNVRGKCPNMTLGEVGDLFYFIHIIHIIYTYLQTYIYIYIHVTHNIIE
jgi:hypothetical protein